MCFGPYTSFTASAILLSAGAYTTHKAAGKNKHYLFFAMIPFIFGLQQLLEGFVWLALLNNHENAVHAASLGYLFFAFFIWPFYIPLSILPIENETKRINVLRYFSLLGVLYGIVIYSPLLLGLKSFTTEIAHYSINYITYDTNPLVSIYLFVYACFVALPFFITSKPRIKKFGILLILALFVSLYFYLYAFTSVWCFFAALLSLYLIDSINKLNHQAK
ncbi:MAG: hypothetical protein A3F14_02240 [Gammaproteobacteria bacterium RIFCSPHIGHO2_12_FULL_43_28]|nr:MAG: hypothetical protein A3F14_02240 [Gammaproteobacteria bacterium RIFCSPHIGHO2_12_FULL_43_28]